MSAPSLSATVVIPTSIDRGPTLALAVDSVLRQTVQDLEVLIIGDGVQEVTREAARSLERQDSRVRFIDHPKHARRGEPYRHQALQEARGRIVCYLCDRDLYLPDHVETMVGLLAEADFATTPVINLGYVGDLAKHAIDLAEAQDRKNLVEGRQNHGLSLSVIGHTLSAYRELPDGWTETPKGTWTDLYFGRKFAANPRFRCVTGVRPTVLYFPHGVHPGWSTAQRFEELILWHRRLSDPAEVRRIREELYQIYVREFLDLQRRLRHRLVYKRKPVNWERVRGFFSRPPV